MRFALYRRLVDVVIAGEEVQAQLVGGRRLLSLQQSESLFVTFVSLCCLRFNERASQT